jgi:hypothetical protein
MSPYEHNRNVTIKKYHSVIIFLGLIVNYKLWLKKIITTVIVIVILKSRHIELVLWKNILDLLHK